jgi:hypothetical protein
MANPSDRDRAYSFGRIFNDELVELGFAAVCSPQGDLEENEDYDVRVRAAFNAQPQELAALCLSGGGIRSAAFALGALQGLARAHG